MDSFHAILFYSSSAVTVGAGLVAALVPSRSRRGLAVAALGVGLAGLYASLSAGFVALVALLAFLAMAALLASPAYRRLEAEPVPRLVVQLGAVGAAALFGVLAYAAFRGDFLRGAYPGGEVGTVAIGRLLLSRDAPALAAVALMALVALVGAALAWRGRRA